MPKYHDYREGDEPPVPRPRRRRRRESEPEIVYIRYAWRKQRGTWDEWFVLLFPVGIVALGIIVFSVKLVIDAVMGYRS